jgi:hypothetical protein
VRSPLHPLRQALLHAADATADAYCHHGRHRFTDRSGKASRLAVILAGYKPDLWPATLARIARFRPADLDVCLVCPGRRVPELERLAAAQGWSVLATSSRRPALGLNLAIARHPAASWIWKLDEDIVIAEGFFDRLQDAYRRIEADGAYRLGFLAPLLHVNGHSYVPFLEHVGQAAGYRARFGGLPRACGGIPAFHDGAAAEFLWRAALPFDATAARIAAAPWTWSLVPHRFSIGAILMQREQLRVLGGFRRSLLGPILGHDEYALCTACVNCSLVMACDHGTLAGHVSFGPQEAALRPFLPELIPRLVPPA